ncbi:MAG: CoB--CoM heterodisulfide reductase iron-sulfur subunit B family protein [Deltaproteobacteria bacterium]|nr:CoB--CoM heterodisulfide reductase iron-sulfur subunit B family protein [Deltaproteobacteria bacterium]
MKIGYFPGCSLDFSAKEFDTSLQAVATSAGMELEEIKDWACCGATSGHATNHLLSIALPARTLALAEEQELERVVAPCAACYSRLATARHEMAEDKKLFSKVTGILKRDFTNSVQVMNIAELLRDNLPAIKEKVTHPLKDLKVACYYGCLLVRPPKVTGFDDTEDPSSMEEVCRAAGATPVKWNKRLDCCGGGFSLSRTGSVIRLGKEILEDAQAAGAQAVVVACPMCHSNLDLRQKAIAEQTAKPLEMPILFITQLVGLAMGISEQILGLNRHFVSAQPIIAKATVKALPAAREEA